jgi:hypothetical protein
MIASFWMQIEGRGGSILLQFRREAEEDPVEKVVAQIGHRRARVGAREISASIVVVVLHVLGDLVGDEADR